MLVARVHKEVTRAILQTMDKTPPDAPLVLQLVRSTQTLLGLQREYLPPQHHELATTLLDYHNALEYALANFPNELYTAFPAELGNFRMASRTDYKARKEGEKIKKLYSQQLENT